VQEICIFQKLVNWQKLGFLQVCLDALLIIFLQKPLLGSAAFICMLNEGIHNLPIVSDHGLAARLGVRQVHLAELENALTRFILVSFHPIKHFDVRLNFAFTVAGMFNELLLNDRLLGRHVVFPVDE